MGLPAINRKSELYKDAEWLRTKYLIEELSKQDIANVCGVSDGTIAYYIRKYKIPTRKGADRATEKLRRRLSDVHRGRPAWNSGMAGNYEKWIRRGSKAPGYRGGVSEHGHRGYRKILCPDHPNADASGYVFEHRLVCERLLGRYLTEDEIVHHRDSNRMNNDPSNLFIFHGHSTHYSFHRAKMYNSDLTEEEFCRGED